MAGDLNEYVIRAAQPKDKKYWLSDHLNGLYLLVTPEGAKYWKFRFRFNGKNDELTAAKPYPRGSLAVARKEARRLQVLVDAGRNPRLEKMEAKVEARRASFSKFAEAANEWHAFRSQAWARRTADQVREYLDRDLIKALGRRSLDDITTEELASLLQAINHRAPDVAKKARQWLGAIFEYARARGWTKSNPTADLKAITHLGAESERHAHLPLEEMPEFLRKLKAINALPAVKGATWLAIWTGNRPGVTRTLRWSEVDLDKGLWTIPRGREEMKRGYPHVTPLPRQAIQHLREIHRISGNFEHVFFGRNDPAKSISDGAVKGMLERMGYGGRQTMHGFRHVASSALNGMGYPADHIERQLAHKDPDKMRGVYNSAPYLAERRSMLQDWADWLDTAQVEAPTGS
nr:integrase arm-type DNA-binding domain-containing protein [Dyella sp. ASV24]